MEKKKLIILIICQVVFSIALGALLYYYFRPSPRRIAQIFQQTPYEETICDDKIDNDDDGYTDCDDVDCNDDPFCKGKIAEDCEDEIDNDGDGYTDCSDPDCFDDPVCKGKIAELICDDYIDNDQDGEIDCDDSDCWDDPNCKHEWDCSDEQDNDGDGYTDCLDYDCRDDPFCKGKIAEDCEDEIDNDGDGYTDCEDYDCADHPDCRGNCLPCNGTAVKVCDVVEGFPPAEARLTIYSQGSPCCLQCDQDLNQCIGGYAKDCSQGCTVTGTTPLQIDNLDCYIIDWDSAVCEPL